MGLILHLEVGEKNPFVKGSTDVARDVYREKSEVAFEERMSTSDIVVEVRGEDVVVHLDASDNFIYVDPLAGVGFVNCSSEFASGVGEERGTEFFIDIFGIIVEVVDSGVSIVGAPENRLSDFDVLRFKWDGPTEFVCDGVF